MRFRDFARNYLNPLYIVFRIMWLWAAFIVAMFVPLMFDVSHLRPLFFVPAAYLVWIGIRPWGQGMSIHQINQKLDEWSNR